jgi:CBS domain-containing protein
VSVATGVKSACDGYGTTHTIKEENMGGQKVREVMTDRPRCVSPETPISDAARLMRSEDVGLLPILEGEKVTGVVTDRDIVIQAVAEEKDPRGMPVREVASRELVTIGPDEDLSEALRLMASYQVRRLPVVDEDSRLVGVLSQADVAREAKEKDVGQMVEEISQTPTGPRV